MINKHFFTPKLIIRFSSYLADIICFIVFAFILSNFVFSNIFSSSEQNKLLSQTLMESNLYIPNEQGVFTQLNNGTLKDYKNIVESYYLTYEDRSDSSNDKVNYFESEFYKVNGGTRKALSVKEYNQNILMAGSEDSYFEFDLVNNEIDMNVLAVVKPKYLVKDYQNQTIEFISEEYMPEIRSFYIQLYKNCFTDLYNDNFYKDTKDEVNLLAQYNLGLSCLLPSTLFYLIIPFLNSDHKTIGRAIFKLGVCNQDGFYAKPWQIALRALPSLILSCIPFFTTNLLVVLTISFGYLLVSACSCVIVENNISIVDFISLTRIFNFRTSTIFKDENDMKNTEETLYGD